MIYNFIIYFWMKNEHEQCSMSEISLYFCLLHEANRQHWVSPFMVSTPMLMARLGTTKQNIMKAREGLMSRGLICFIKGGGKGKPAMYTLLLGSLEKGTQSQEFTNPLADSFTDPLSDSLTDPFTNPLTIYYKEKKKNKENEEDKEEKSPSSISKTIPLDQLRNNFLGDDEWLQELSGKLVKRGIALSAEGLRKEIADFFTMLENKECKGKEEADCRNYLLNWIIYNKNKKGYGKGKIIGRCDGGRSNNKIKPNENEPDDYDGFC